MMNLACVFLLSGVTLAFPNLIKDGVSCECKKFGRCKYWVEAVSRDKYVDLPVCGYDPHTLAPLLCCPSADVNWMSTTNRTKREINSLQGLDNIQLSCTIKSHSNSPAQIANQKCEEYGKLVFQSLYEVSVGGSPLQSKTMDTCGKSDEDTGYSESREFPHMALIGFGMEDIKWTCGGSLISERFILGVAVCSNLRVDQPATWAKLGDLDISTDTDVARPQLYRISERIVHPDYTSSIFYHDIALFKLDKDVTFTIYVRPACIFTRRDPPDNKADGTGWGQESFRGKPSKTLKKIKMDLVTNEDCNKVYNVSQFRNRIPDGIRGDNLICAKEAVSSGLQICQGDSGGPLQIPLKKPYCMYGIIGLTSFGKECGKGFPGAFTRVSHYVPWIVENVWSE